MKQKWIDAYLDTAERFAQLSSATRLKVGAVVVKDNRITSIGYNGTPAGWDNTCEDKEYMPIDAGGWLSPEEIEERWPIQEQQLPKEDDVWLRLRLKTKSEVIHAEANAISKLAKSNDGGDGADLFCTHAPCIDCAKLIYGAGIKKVYYRNVYRDDYGIQFLQKGGVEVERVE